MKFRFTSMNGDCLFINITSDLHTKAFTEILHVLVKSV